MVRCVDTDRSQVSCSWVNDVKRRVNSNLRSTVLICSYVVSHRLLLSFHLTNKDILFIVFSFTHYLFMSLPFYYLTNKNLLSCTAPVSLLFYHLYNSADIKQLTYHSFKKLLLLPCLFVVHATSLSQTAESNFHECLD